MEVKVGDTSYSGYGHGSRVSGVNTLCVDHGTNKPSEWVSLKITTTYKGHWQELLYEIISESLLFRKCGLSAKP